MKKTNRLRRNLATVLLVLTIALFSVVIATFAWYIYNTNAHTTKVHMVAGTSSSLQIAQKSEGKYSSSAVLDAFAGALNPVSTDKIANGFQKVYGFTNGMENQPVLVANLFGPGEYQDYYRTSLYLRANIDDMKVYVSDISYQDDDAQKPISTAIRIGLVPYSASSESTTKGEYIFAINQADNPQAEYNTERGHEGCVLDSTKTDGSVVEFTPYTSENFISYNNITGATTLKKDSVPICTLYSNGNGDYGKYVKLDVYIWLEGCDKDCTKNLGDSTLKNISISFAGYVD